MKIIILGAGEVGFNIARRLVGEGHDVLVIERDEHHLSHATEALDIQGLLGHGARPNVLEEAGIAEADMLVAATNADEVNMVACVTAAILGKPDIIKIARIRADSYLDPRVFGDDRMCIDLAINPEKVTADRILALLRFPAVTEVVDFAEGRILLVGLRITPTSPLAGMRFFDLRDRLKNTEMLIAAIHRGDEVIIPRGPDVVLPGDEVHIVARRGEVEQVLAMAGVQVSPVRRIMISGATKIGRYLAKALEAKGIKPKLIEPDAEQAQRAANKLPDTIVLRGNPTDAELLMQENVGEMHAFIACGADEEANVMSALLARRLGARRVIATTNRSDYQPLMKAIGIDVSISPRLVAVSSIMHFIRRGSVLAVSALGEDESAEALEFKAEGACGVVGKPLRELNIPQGAIIAGVIRGDEVIIPKGDTTIEPGDHVLVVALKSAVPKLEKIFARSMGVR